MAQTSWLAPAGKLVQTAALAAAVDHFSVHTDQPDNTGSNELGSTTRSALTLQADSGTGALSLTSATDMTIPATVDPITFVGLWDDATFLLAVSVPSEPYPNGGTFKVNSAVGTLNDSVA